MSSSTLLLIFFFFFSVGINAAPRKSNIKSVVDECCPSSIFGCCKEAVLFRKPLNCSESTSINNRAISCVEKALFQETENVVVEDLPCCEVFEHDQTDPSKECFSVCQNTINTPSLKNKAELIEKCSVKNPLYGCFKSCQNRRRQQLPIDMPRHFNKFCDFKLLLSARQ